MLRPAVFQLRLLYIERGITAFMLFTEEFQVKTVKAPAFSQYLDVYKSSTADSFPDGYQVC